MVEVRDKEPGDQDLLKELEDDAEDDGESGEMSLEGKEKKTTVQKKNK